VSNPLSYIGQGFVYAAVAAFTAYFASSPDYRQVPEGMAQIKMALNHGGARAEECHRLTAEELSKLPSTERRPSDCSRERLPVVVRLALDGNTIYDATLEPTGLSRDGQARAYEKFWVAAGRHEITAELRDSKRQQGYDYQKTAQVDLKPWQNFSIEFQAEQGGFLFR